MFVVTLCVLFLVLYLWKRYRIAYSEAPKKIPILKCFKILLRNTDMWNKIIEACKLVQEGGGVACGFFYDRGIRGLYILTDPEDSMMALKSCPEKDLVYDYWKPWIGVGTFTGDLQTNKFHRKIYTKLFMLSNMEVYLKNFNKHSERLVEKLSSRIDQGPFGIGRDLKLYNFEILCDNFLGFHDLGKVNINQYLDAVSSYIKIVIQRFESIFLQHDFIFDRTELKKKQDAALNVLCHTSDTIIRHRRQYLKDIKEKNCGPPNNDLFLDVLLEVVDKGIVTEKVMKTEVDGMLFAANDTTANSLLFLLVLMGSYPHVQERAYEELQQVLGDRKHVCREDLSKMGYLEAIIKESLRIYPYVPILPRRVEEDVKLKNCTLRAGCTVAVFTWGVHRHESWGPDAEEFRPERWLEPDKLPKPIVLLGFSEGARACIGRRYAMISMKTLLAYLVRSYRFKADHTKLCFEYLGVLEPVSGHHVAIEKRT